MRYNQPQSGPLQLDGGNPITRGIAFAFVSLNGQAMGWRAGKPTNITAVSNAARVLTTQGKALASASVSDYIYDTGQTGMTGANYGLFAACTANSPGVQSAIDDDSGGGSGNRVLQFRLNSFKAELITFDTAGNPYFVAAAAPLSADQLNAGFTMGAQVAGNAIAIFQNGVKTSATASGTQKTSAGDLRVGNYKGGGNSGWTTGGLSLVVGWSRTPTDAEFKSMAANPWQLFKQPNRLFAAAAGGANTYSYTAAGGFVLSGVATEVRGIARAAAGGITTSGMANARRGTTRSTTGGVTFAGAATQVKRRAITALGGIVMSGSASIVRRAARAAAGGLQLAGAATVTFFSGGQSRIVVATGGMIIRGAAAIRRSVRKLALGGVLFSGAATVTRTDRTPNANEYYTTIMRISTVYVDAGAPSSSISTTGQIKGSLSLTTIMRATTVNETGTMSAAPINLTGNLL